MGQSSAATVREIEDLRGRLDADMRELERRLPQPAVWAKRAVGIAVGGGIGGLILLRVVKKARDRRKAKKTLMADGRPAQAVIQVLPEDVAERVADRFSAALEDGRWKQWAAGGAAVWLGIRLLEIRQLRRLNRELLAGRA
jgi:hypothetical protein